MKRFFIYITILILVNFKTLWGQSVEDRTLHRYMLAFCGSKTDSVKKPINLDWVQTDKDNITRLNMLPARGASMKAIQEFLHHFNDPEYNFPDQVLELGYGLQSIQHKIYGGYGSCQVDAIYFGDHVLTLRLTIYNYAEIIADHLYDVMQLPFKCGNRSVRYDTTYADHVNMYTSDSWQIFLASADTNYQRQKAINYFTDVLSDGTFREPFYVVSGLGTETFNYLRYFIVNKDYAALESILFSPAPTSRLYAARTLVYMQQQFSYVPGPVTKKRMKEVLAHAQPIKSGIVSCFINKFHYDSYDFVKDFELFLRTK